MIIKKNQFEDISRQAQSLNNRDTLVDDSFPIVTDVDHGVVNDITQASLV